MHGLTQTYYLSISKSYLAEGRILKGRQMLWLIFQNNSVDTGSLNLFKSQQLRAIKLGNNLPAFLNKWTEHLSLMEEKPSTSEIFHLFVEQVREYKPMLQTWSLLDQGILTNVEYPPTYETYLKLCWDHIGREAKQQAKNALLGRSNKVSAAAGGQSPPAPAAPPSLTKAEKKLAAAGAASPGSPPGKGKGKDPKSPKGSQSVSRNDADSKLCKENKYCFAFFSTGKCPRGKDCPYAHVTKMSHRTHVEPYQGNPGSPRSPSKGRDQSRGRTPTSPTARTPSRSPGPDKKLSLIHI